VRRATWRSLLSKRVVTAASPRSLQRSGEGTREQRERVVSADVGRPRGVSNGSEHGPPLSMLRGGPAQAKGNRQASRAMLREKQTGKLAATGSSYGVNQDNRQARRRQ